MSTLSAINRKKVFEMTVFAMLGAVMFISKLIMEVLPNIHLLGMFIMTYTIVYRIKALIPIYVFVFLTGIYAGFSFWWIPYLYIWAILFLITLLLPKNMPKGVCMIVYPLVCALYGLCYGTLYAPAQALLFGLDFSGMIAWIIAGLPFDFIHAGGNLVAGLLVLPLTNLIKKLHRINV